MDAARTAAGASAAIESWKVEDGAKRLDAGALAALASVNWFSDIEIRLRDEIAKLGSRAPRAQATLEALVDRVVQARSLDEVRRSRRGKGVSRRAGPARTP